MFEDTLKITRDGSEDLTDDASFSSLSTQNSSAEPSLIYEGLSEQQDRLSEYDRDRLGDVDTQRFVKCYLPDDVDIAGFEVGDRAVTRYGEGEVRSLSEFDGLLYVRLD